MLTVKDLYHKNWLSFFVMKPKGKKKTEFLIPKMDALCSAFEKLSLFENHSHRHCSQHLIDNWLQIYGQNLLKKT